MMQEVVLAVVAVTGHWQVGEDGKRLALDGRCR
jgi:hypothetical protein